jgi:hypothetical protein
VGNDSLPALPDAALNQARLRQTLTRELALLAGLLFLGMVVVPIGLYLLGGNVFGEYAGHGFGDFFGTLSAKLRNGEKVAWFFVLSPYFVVQLLRLTAFGWRATSIPPRL